MTSGRTSSSRRSARTSLGGVRVGPVSDERSTAHAAEVPGPKLPIRPARGRPHRRGTRTSRPSPSALARVASARSWTTRSTTCWASTERRKPLSTCTRLAIRQRHKAVLPARHLGRRRPGPDLGRVLGGAALRNAMHPRIGSELLGRPGTELSSGLTRVERLTSP